MIKNIIAKLTEVQIMDMKITRVTRLTRIKKSLKRGAVVFVVSAVIGCIGWQNFLIHNMRNISKAQQGTVAYQIDRIGQLETLVNELSSSPEQVTKLEKELWGGK